MVMAADEVIVVGGGAMGTAAAWRLAARGHRVTVLDRFGPAGHAHGASHGETRNFNMAYAEPEYVDFANRARDLWDELADVAGETLLDLVGLVSQGPADLLARIRRTLDDRGVPHETLSAAEAAGRWSGMRFVGEALFLPGSGRIRAARALAAMRAAAKVQGAEFRDGTRVTAVEAAGDRVVVATPEGTLEAPHAVVTAGAWTERLLGGRVPLPPLAVTEEQPAHFAITDQGATWPSFNHFRGLDPAREAVWRGAAAYGMLTPGEGVKVGWHAAGPPVDPDRRTFTPDDGVQRALARYVSEWFPGLDPTSAVPVSCTYTSTPGERFLLERFGRVVVGAGFSGMGFKFVPAIGDVLARLVEGEAGPAFVGRGAHGL